MNKLKLRLDDLQVDTFETTRPQKEKGTVFGEQCTCYTNCTCPGCPTCYQSCNGSCEVSCNGTCGATCDASCQGTCDYCGPSYANTCDGYNTCATAPSPDHFCNFC